MKNTPTYYGLLLAVITLIIFFIVYFLYIGFDYYNISVKVNAFVLPALYTLIAVILLYKKSNVKKLTFASSFQYSFSTMFIGGTLSFLIIAFFFNYIDKEAQVLLQHQRIEQNIESINNEYQSIDEPTAEQTDNYKTLIESMNSESVRNAPLFNLKNSFIILGILYSFYLIISVLLSIFFRIRNPNAAIDSNSPTQ